MELVEIGRGKRRERDIKRGGENCLEVEGDGE